MFVNINCSNKEPRYWLNFSSLQFLASLMNKDYLTPVTQTGDSEFLLACRHDNLAQLKILFENFCSDFQTQSRVELEVANPRRAVVDILSHHYNKYGKGLLHECAQNSSLECLRFLLDDLKMNADSLKQGDWTPLMLACAAKNDKSRAIVRLLIDRGADVQRKNKDGWTAFHIACRSGDAKKLQTIMEDDPKSWKTKSLNGCEGVVEFLLTIPEIEIDRPDVCGTTALMDAIRAGKSEIIEILIANEADVNKSDKLGRKAVHIAAICGDNECLNSLFHKYSADINGKTLEESSMVPIHFAAKEGHISTIEKLIALGANPAAVDRFGRNILHFAAIGQKHECFAYIEGLGVEDCTDKFGRRASTYWKKIK
uniref:Uncharacterized protein n=1 Tax=Romanomermis culicivorax TaxID=13658 RepID=A0A915J413_ROMCU